MIFQTHQPQTHEKSLFSTFANTLPSGLGGFCQAPADLVLTFASGLLHVAG
jgi:hypothetical protein